MPLFTALTVVHLTRSRMRLRYRTGTSFDKHSLKRLLELRSGVDRVELGGMNRSIRVWFDPDVHSVHTIMCLLEGMRADAFVALERNRHELENSQVHSVFRGVLAFALTPMLPPPLRGLLTLLACGPAIGQGLRHLFAGKITSETMEGAAILISIGRRDYAAAYMANLLIALAEYIGQRIDRQSDELLLSLVQPEAEQVWVRRQDQDVLVQADQVTKGTIVIAQAGETVAVDGTVLEGQASVNEVSMTGEALPVSKSRGDRLISGTTVEEGRVLVYAEQVGQERVSFRIASYVESSLQSKSHAQLNAARLADRLVPFSLGLAGSTYLLSRDLAKVAAVLQADYSCALKLATPVAFKSSMYKAGAHQILVKSASALEKLATADVFIFDKTGTLTSGDLEVMYTLSMDPGWTSEQILLLAASIEEHYFHPIAQAVVKAAQQNGASRQHFHHSEVEFIVAHGVMAYVEGKKVVIGSRHFLEDDEGITFPDLKSCIRCHYGESLTPLYIGYDGKLLGIICLRDELRPESHQLLEALRKNGMQKAVMLTGDRREKAIEIAESLGFDECHYELHPEHKAAIVEEYRSQGKTCAFIGDGINDAPALSLADVGIAMQKGADIARISADIALLHDDILLVSDIHAMARHTMKRVSTNYGLTIGLNSVIMLLAVIGRISPITTAVLHNGTTIGILMNAALGARTPRRIINTTPAQVHHETS
ncbi:heavy metal translocating P-type ATPase [Desulfurispira natronophila]|uniref:P-type Zn(2+) transporter n=1 Tax=Desulfurispira natronophila TaxID=682562 RepID=A0A7W7Y3P1_9BACT|nr:heavy metal translocating P-type ATPase [Desulfurispira natronophila]MBB5021521.1 heavy metal translocating P-type ATPase [Desulfurispira natronophila]